MRFQCIVRVNRTVGKWNSDIVDAPVFWVEAQNHAEALSKVKQMFDSLLIANDSLYLGFHHIQINLSSNSITTERVVSLGCVY